MEASIYTTGSSYLPIKEAAKSAKFTGDYVSRLCRTGKVIAHKVGKNWYVEEFSFHQFVQNEKGARELRRRQLAEEYARNRNAARAIEHVAEPREAQPVETGVATRIFDVQTALRGALAKNPQRSSVSHLVTTIQGPLNNSLAVVFALCIVAGGWTFCAPTPSRVLAANFTQKVGGVFEGTLHANPQRSAIALDSAGENVAVRVDNLAIDVGNEELDGMAQVGNALSGYSDIYNETDHHE